MGTVGLQLATTLGRTFVAAEKQGVRLADGSRIPFVGHVIMPITRDIRVAIMPQLYADCYLGVNFVRAFRAVLDPDTDWLFCRDAEAYVELEVGHRSYRSIRHRARGRYGPSENGAEAHGRHDPGQASAKQRPYPVSDRVQEELHRQVCEMLNQGIIEPSKSGWSSLAVMTPKSDGTRRFCIDLRMVNAVTEPDAYSLPNMQDILRKLRKAKFISTLDLNSAYHQVPLAEEAQFRRMPYGLMNASDTFQRLIDQVLGPELEPYVYAYLDDIIIVAETFEKHKKCLRMVLERLVAAGLTLNAAKCVFCKTEVAYLGFFVNREGTRPNPANIEPIKNYPVLRNLKALRRFLGTSSWYRRFIPNYATIAEPLTNLTKKNQKYEWLEE